MERIILDPSEETISRFEFDVTDWISADGADWGEAAIEASMADQTIGASPVDYRIPNRVVSIPLTLAVRGGTAALTARNYLQQKAGLFQREGGVLKRITQGGGIVYADIVNATLSLSSVAGFESRAGIDIDASLNLECRPDFYGSELSLTDRTESTLPEITWNETSIAGNYPAGNRVRIVVDDDSAHSQRGLFGGIRSRHYSSATTAALAYSAEALQPLDTATKPALSGASGGTVVTHGTVSTNWTPVVGTNLAGTQYLTHTGSYRVRARVYSTSGTTVRSRFVWGVNDLTNPVQNPETRVPGPSNFYIVDYGEVRLDPAPIGVHRWQGQIQAAGTDGTENFSVDRIWFQPTAEGAWQLKAPVPESISPTTFSVRSEFNTEGGTITGDTLAQGGTWTGAGDADDFTVVPGAPSISPGYAQRTAVSDADLNTGRYITASGVIFTSTAAQVAFLGSKVLGRFGVLARYTNTSNWLFLGVDSTAASNVPLALIKRVAGTSTTIKIGAGTIRAGVGYTFRLAVYADGYYSAAMATGLGAFKTVFTGYDSALASSGALAGGRVGIYDAQANATASLRVYNNFAAWAPPDDAVIFASRSAEISSNGARRLDTGGTAYGPVPWTEGDLPRLPVSGLEARTTQLMIKPSRGDLDNLADVAIDDMSVRIAYRPCYITVPEA